MNPNSSNRARSKLALIRTRPQLFISHATRFICIGRKNPSQLKKPHSPRSSREPDRESPHDEACHASMLCASTHAISRLLMKKIAIAFPIDPEFACMLAKPMCRAHVLPNSGPNQRNPTGIATTAHASTAR